MVTAGAFADNREQRSTKTHTWRIVGHMVASSIQLAIVYTILFVKGVGLLISKDRPPKEMIGATHNRSVPNMI